LGIVAALLGSASAVDGAAPSTSKWKVMSEAARDYTITYPAGFKVTVPKVQTCSDQQCRATDELLLTGPEGSIDFVAQRNINPSALPVQSWYESLAHRAFQPASEALVEFAGRQAIRRGPLVPAETVVMKGGKEVSRALTLVHHETIFVPMNGSDILTISLQPKGSEADGTLTAILNTLTFAQ
jgi:hypothetical protein